MKTTLFFILLLGLSFSATAQNLRITIGRGTNCFGRGACSIELSSQKLGNAELTKNAYGEIVLRLYRSRLSQHEENNILEAPISGTNVNSLKFILTERLTFPEDINPVRVGKSKENITSLAPRAYQTHVSIEFIDILLPKQ